MTFPDAIRSGFGQYATFTGRASRAEYWWFSLFVFLAGLVAWIPDVLLGLPLFQASVMLVLLVPHLAVGVRRLHDTDRRGWWLLLPLLTGVSGVTVGFGAVVAVVVSAFSGSETGLGVALLAGGVAALLLATSLISSLVLMLRAGTPTPNRFGPPPGSPLSSPPGVGYGYGPYPPTAGPRP